MDEPTRAERHGQTHEKILSAAMETVVTKGFSGLSMNKLAAQVGFTPGALYRYFEGKDELIAALVVDIVAEVGRHIAGAVEGEDAIADLSRAAWVWRDYARHHPHRFGLIAALLASPRLVIEDDRYAYASIEKTLAALAPITASFARAQHQRHFTPGDPIQRTLLFFAALHGVLSLRKQAERAPERLDLDELYRAMLATLFKGFGHDPQKGEHP
jgi:AcrR family transcriptional regulator